MHDFGAAALADALVRAQVDVVCVTGDVTENGKVAEGDLFWKLFGKLAGRLVLVPGNHDRGTDDVARDIVAERGRAWTVECPWARFICLDSTQPGNEVPIFAWGGLDDGQVAFAADAAKTTEPHRLPVVLLHHHVLPAAPGEDIVSAVSDAFKMPFLRQVENGRRLLAALPGHSLILHGHRHKETQSGLVYNAGSSTELGKFRLFEVANGAIASCSWFAAPLCWTPEAEAVISAAL